MDHGPDIVKEWRDVRMIKIHHHNDRIARTACILVWSAFPVIRCRAHPGVPGDEIARSIVIQVPAGANRDPQISGIAHGRGRVQQQTSREIQCLVADRLHAGGVLVGVVHTAGRAIGDVVFSCNRITNGLPGNVLDQQPGGEKQRKIDDAEDKQQQYGQGDGELQHALGFFRPG
jgi:hypothetical protein